jgi:Cohesin domain
LDSIASWVDDVYAYFFGREIRVGSAEGKSGHTVVVPVELRGQGGETAISFTLEYDGSMLSNPNVSVASAFETAVLTVNSNEKGRVGVVIDLGDPVNFSADPITIVYVRFDVSKDADVGEAPVALTGSIAATGVSDAFGETLSTRYVGGKVSILRQ